MTAPRRIGRIRIADKVLLSMLHLDEGKVVSASRMYDRGITEFLIEHPDMPAEYSDGSNQVVALEFSRSIRPAEKGEMIEHIERLAPPG